MLDASLAILVDVAERQVQDDRNGKRQRRQRDRLERGPKAQTAIAPIAGPTMIDTDWMKRRTASTCCMSSTASPGIDASNEGLSS